MLTTYIHAAMRGATYELLPDREGFYGDLQGFDGVWANAPTLEGCRDELQETLEEWLLLGLGQGHPLPIIDGIDVTFHKEAT